MSIRNELLEQILAASQIGIGELPEFEVETSDTISISSVSASPSYITNLVVTSSLGGIELVTTGPWAGTGAMINNSSLTLDMLGLFDFHPDNTGSASRLDMWTEKSVDGIVVNENAGSARVIEIANNAESTGTKSSRITGWAPGEMLRFAMYDSGTGAISLVQSSVLANGANVVTGPSFFWALETVRAT